MKIVDEGVLAGAIVLFFVSLYCWLAKGQIDDAAFFFSLALAFPGSLNSSD